MRLALAELIDPRLLALADASREFYANRVAGRGPRSREELEEVRAAVPARAPASPPAVEELVGAGDRRVPVRIHTPSGRPARGVLLDIHGGGFFMGSAADRDLRSRQLVEALGIAVVSVEYRLAPEHPWPAAPDDCETAALWLHEHAARRLGTTKLAVGGFSGGATLALVTLLRLRGRGINAYSSGVLEFGTYDLSGQTAAGRLIAEEYFLDAYAGAAADRTDPDLSPIYADLAGLPPVLLVVGEDDILVDDNMAMAARLSAAGVDVALQIYPASPHGFTGHPTPMARAARHRIEAWLGEQLGVARA